jgi:hypothetical protein
LARPAVLWKPGIATLLQPCKNLVNATHRERNDFQIPPHGLESFRRFGGRVNFS